MQCILANENRNAHANFVILNQVETSLVRSNQDYLVMLVQNSRGGPKAFNYKPLALTMRLADTESVSGTANGEPGSTLQAHPNSP